MSAKKKYIEKILYYDRNISFAEYNYTIFRVTDR